MRCFKNDSMSPGVCNYKTKIVDFSKKGTMVKYKSIKDSTHVYKNYKSNTSDENGTVYCFKNYETACSTGNDCEFNTKEIQTLIGINDLRVMHKNLMNKSLEDY